MSYNLFIGDVDEELSFIAKESDPNSTLLVAGQTPEPGNTYYTSVADMEKLDKFSEVCLNAKNITYAPPDHWKNNSNPDPHSQQGWTEYILTHVSQYVTCNNLPDRRKKYSLSPYDIEEYKDLDKQEFDRRFISPLEPRKTEGTQIWAVGDSVTYGIAVPYEETWKVKISKKMNLPFSDLSINGSSIIWASNQILQSDIRKDDYVFWGVTTHNRFLGIHPETLDPIHLVSTSYERSAVIREKVPLDYIDSDTTIMQNINAIRNVYNFCKQIGAKLVIQGVLIDWDNLWINFDIPCYQQTMFWDGVKDMIDYGDDGQHPGPRQHDQYVEEFLKLAKKWYG